MQAHDNNLGHASVNSDSHNYITESECSQVPCRGRRKVQKARAKRLPDDL
jgi:hypothetical protein